MSETPQGPGWWLASDGRYYPPAQQPGPQPGQYQPAQYPPAQYPPAQQPGPQPGQYPPAQSGYPAPRRRSGGRGCLTSLVIVVVLVLGLALAGKWAMGRASSWFGQKKDDLVGGAGCPFANDAEVAGIVGGGKITLVKAGSLTSIVSNIVDSRVIPDAPSCWAMSDATATAQNPGRLLRIASETSGTAATVFKAEVTKAKGVTVDKGNGLSVSSEPYYSKPVPGLGDQAFCTSASTSGPGSAGVLVRQGDRLVYVSLTPDFSRGAPGIGTPGRTTLSTDDASCDLAQKIARVVLAH